MMGNDGAVPFMYCSSIVGIRVADEKSSLADTSGVTRIKPPSDTVPALKSD